MTVGGNVELYFSSDPYVKVHVFDRTFESKVVSKSLNPEWNQFFTIDMGEPRGIFHVEVFDHDKITKDEHMGQFTFNCAEFADGQVHDRWFKLVPKKKEKVSGEIRLKIQWHQKK